MVHFNRERYAAQPYYQSPFRALSVVGLLMGLTLGGMIFLGLILTTPVGEWPMFCLALCTETATTGALTLLYTLRIGRVSADKETELRIRKQRSRVCLWLAVSCLVGGAAEFSGLLISPVMAKNDLPMAGMVLLMLLHVAAAICLMLVLVEPLQKHVPPPPRPPPPPPAPLPRRHFDSHQDPTDTGLDDSELSGDWDQATAAPVKKKKKKGH